MGDGVGRELWPAEPGGDVRGDRPQVLLAHVLHAVAAGGGLEQRQPEGGVPLRSVSSSDR